MIIKTSNLTKNICLRKISLNRYFSTLNQETKYFRDRALLASSIIKKIWSKNTNDGLKDLSLYQSIIKYLDQVKNVEEKARQELLSYFKNGFYYDQGVWSQQRFKNAQLQQKGKIKLYPTRFMTSIIFRKLLNGYFRYQYDERILVGSLGISKSFSAAIFTHLSNIVVEYNFKNYPKKEYEDKNSGIIDAPKVFYLNFNQQEFLDFKIRQKLLRQLQPEIPQENRQNFLNNNVFRQKPDYNSKNQSLLSPYSAKKIDAILILDQISQYLFLLRKKQQGSNVQSQIKRIKKIIKSLDIQFRSVIYLSSIDIQRDLLRESQLKIQNTPIKTFIIPYAKNLWKQEYIQEVIDIFLLVFQQRFNLKQLSQYNITTKTQSILLKNKIKQRLYDYLLLRRSQYFLSFLHIRQGIKIKFNEEHNSLGSVQKVYEKYQNLSPQNLQTRIEQMLQETMKYSEEQIAIAFKQFIDKRLSRKQIQIQYELIFQLYTEAKLALIKGTQFNKHQFRLKNNKYREEINDTTTNINRLVYKQFFQFDQKQQGVLKCNLTPSIVVKVLNPKITQAIPFIIRKRTDLLMKYSKRAGKSDCIQILFIQALKRKTLCLFNLNPLILQDLNQIFVSNISPEIKQYQEIPKSKRKSKKIKAKQNQEERFQFFKSFQKQITQVIQKIKKTSQLSEVKQTKKSLIFVPIKRNLVQIQKKKKQIEQLISQPSKLNQRQKLLMQKYKQLINQGSTSSDNSKAIDFILVQITRQQKQNIIKVYAFDMTISYKQQTQKLVKFIDSFLKFEQKNQDQIQISLSPEQKQKYKVQLRYFVIAPIQPNPKLHDLLNSKFKTKNIFFTPAPTITLGNQNVDTSYLNVTGSSQLQNCLLKSVGCFNIFNGVELKNNEELKDKSLSINQTDLWKEVKKYLRQEFKKKKEYDQIEAFCERVLERQRT